MRRRSCVLRLSRVNARLASVDHGHNVYAEAKDSESFLTCTCLAIS